MLKDAGLHFGKTWDYDWVTKDLEDARYAEYYLRKSENESNMVNGDRRTYRNIFILILWHHAGRPTSHFCTRMARKKTIAT